MDKPPPPLRKAGLKFPLQSLPSSFRFHLCFAFHSQKFGLPEVREVHHVCYWRLLLAYHWVSGSGRASSQDFEKKFLISRYSAIYRNCSMNRSRQTSRAPSQHGQSDCCFMVPAIAWGIEVACRKIIALVGTVQYFSCAGKVQSSVQGWKMLDNIYSRPY